MQVGFQGPGQSLHIDWALTALDLESFTALNALLSASATVLERRVRTGWRVKFDLTVDETLDVPSDAWLWPSLAFGATVKTRFVDRRRRQVTYELAPTPTGGQRMEHALEVTIRRIRNYRDEPQLAPRLRWVVSAIVPIRATES